MPGPALRPPMTLSSPADLPEPQGVAPAPVPGTRAGSPRGVVPDCQRRAHALTGSRAGTPRGSDQSGSTPPDGGGRGGSGGCSPGGRDSGRIDFALGQCRRPPGRRLRRRYDRQPGAARYPPVVASAGCHQRPGPCTSIIGQLGAPPGPRGIRVRPVLDASPVAGLRLHRPDHTRLLQRRCQCQRQSRRERPGVERIPESGSGQPGDPGPRCRRPGRVDDHLLQPADARLDHVGPELRRPGCLRR